MTKDAFDRLEARVTAAHLAKSTQVEDRWRRRYGWRVRFRSLRAPWRVGPLRGLSFATDKDVTYRHPLR